jgi:hypothetical protein
MKFDIYCDESHPDVFWSKAETRARFLLIGGLWLPTEERAGLKEQIRQLKEQHGFHHEIKWHKVHDGKMDFYRSLIDLFLQSELRFRCIAVEGDKVDMVRFHQSDQELGFYKFYYQMVKHWLDDFNDYRIFCDEKTNRSGDRLATLRKTLDCANLTSSVLAVQALPSKEVVLIQLADFLLGMASSRLNETVAPGSCKDIIIQHLEQGLKQQGFRTDRLSPTWKSERKFNIFKINLQGGW